jgi:hypothetical protein
MPGNDMLFSACPKPSETPTLTKSTQSRHLDNVMLNSGPSQTIPKPPSRTQDSHKTPHNPITHHSPHMPYIPQVITFTHPPILGGL